MFVSVAAVTNFHKLSDLKKKAHNYYLIHLEVGSLKWVCGAAWLLEGESVSLPFPRFPLSVQDPLPPSSKPVEQHLQISLSSSSSTHYILFCLTLTLLHLSYESPVITSGPPG